MGIDIYAEWRGGTADESAAQVTGFSAIHGYAGYLREAYHGGPYVTKYFVAEAFASKTGEAAIAASTLRARLPAAVLMHLYREHKVYGGGKDPSRIELADLEKALRNVGMKEVADVSHEDFAAGLTPKSIATAEKLIAGKLLPDTAQAFVDFVELCERKERETGEPVRIIASY
jgi:hypothetical protein